MCRIEPATTEQVKGFTVELYQDTDATDPREDYDHFGTMVCWHRNYNLGDDQPGDSPTEWRLNMAASFSPDLEDQINYWQEGEGYGALRRKYNGRATEKSDKIVNGLVEKILGENIPVMLPLFLYDHSGITMSTSRRGWPFNCPWDCGQVGWIYATTEKIREEYGDLSAESLKKATDLLVAEVETYDQYLTGDVWGYVVKCSMCKEVVDSCWGFFGSDYAISEGKSAAESLPECCEIIEDLGEFEEEDY